MKNPRFYDSVSMDRVSAIRLDREGREPGKPANDPNRDPINESGTISVDLAAIGDRADTPSGKIARLISVGNAIRASERAADSSLNHNICHFDQAQYGTSAGFADLVEFLDAEMNNLVKERPAKDDEGFRGAYRRIKRKAGKSAMHLTGIGAA